MAAMRIAGTYIFQTLAVHDFPHATVAPLFGAPGPQVRLLRVFAMVLRRSTQDAVSYSV